MNFRDARKLHNGDEVISKETGESINVLSAEIWPYGGGRKGELMPTVRIEGVGNKSGYGYWSHGEVR